MGTQAFFSELMIRTDEARRGFENHPVVQDAVANGMSLERYRRFLLELYHVVWHFNPVSAAAASRIADSHRAVRYYLYEHMQDEAGHEEWVLEDLDAIGVTPGDTRAWRPGVDTLAMCGYNYWAADRGHPCSVLGMMYVLEVIASVYAGPFANAVKESLLLQGERGTSFVASHATMDAEHMASLRTILNAIEDEPARNAIIESTLVNFGLFTRVFESA